jgi:hypothetical protein
MATPTTNRQNLVSTAVLSLLSLLVHCFLDDHQMSSSSSPANKVQNEFNISLCPPIYDNTLFVPSDELVPTSAYAVYAVFDNPFSVPPIRHRTWIEKHLPGDIVLVLPARMHDSEQSAIGRSVWFMARPLARKGISPGSNAVVAFNHWGIVISSMTRHQMQQKMTSHGAGPASCDWGDLHELRNHDGEAGYERRNFCDIDYQRATRWTYLCQTDLTDEELHDFGISRTAPVNVFRSPFNSSESTLSSP